MAKYAQAYPQSCSLAANYIPTVYKFHSLCEYFLNNKNNISGKNKFQDTAILFIARILFYKKGNEYHKNGNYVSSIYR